MGEVKMLIIKRSISLTNKMFRRWILLSNEIVLVQTTAFFLLAQ